LDSLRVAGQLDPKEPIANIIINVLDYWPELPYSMAA
jgi:hypothetical protein